MSLVDDRARVFGRYNLIDVAFAILLLGLIPLAYGAYVLFREPLPKLTAVTPATLPHEAEFRVTVQGEHLRPFMRVSLNDMQGRAFLFKSETSAEVVFGDIPPGQYDVVLYDNVQERSRLPKAFTLAPAPIPPAQIDVAGFLTSLEPELAKQVIPGFMFGTKARVMSVGKTAPDLARASVGDKTLEIPIENTVRLPVLMRINCDIAIGSDGLGHCVSGQVLAPNVYVKLPYDFGYRPFLVIEMRPLAPVSTFDVRVLINPNDPALPAIRAGDVDVGYSQNEFAGGGRVIEPPAGNRIVTVRVPAYPTLNGWIYASQYVRTGAPLQLVTQRYQVTGIIQSEPPPLPPK